MVGESIGSSKGEGPMVPASEAGVMMTGGAPNDERWYSDPYVPAAENSDAAYLSSKGPCEDSTMVKSANVGREKRSGPLSSLSAAADFVDGPGVSARGRDEPVGPVADASYSRMVAEAAFGPPSQRQVEEPVAGLSAILLRRLCISGVQLSECKLVLLCDNALLRAEARRRTRKRYQAPRMARMTNSPPRPTPRPMLMPPELPPPCREVGMFVVVADEVEGGSMGVAVVLRNAVGGMAEFILENHAGPPGTSSRYA